ncbi:MAG: ADP compounds hydrolase NudE [Gammaproteobacteria bacterium]|nr:ADP compounds hydrolase NudE [Gammaproteobacteria bacterium]MDH5691894.1 ADP compounds hydrolase NudE [Gammaproteobacteria bacterium]
MLELKSKQAPTLLASKTIAKTRIFHVEAMSLQFSNGTEVEYERMLSSPAGAVLVVPLLDNDTVLMIREYAAGVQRYELALPKGRLEQGEDLLEGANRELMEEVGYGAKRLEHVNSYTIAPGYISHTTHVVLAQDLYPSVLEGDEPEEIEVVRCSLSRLSELLAHEECTEARSIAALYWVRDYLADR